MNSLARPAIITLPAHSQHTACREQRDELPDLLTGVLPIVFVIITMSLR